MGTTRYGASAHGSTRGAGQYYDRQFFDALFGEGITAIGDAHDDCKMDNIRFIDFRAMRWEYYARVLLGEPSMDIWTEAPGHLTVTLPEVIHTSANEVEISVTDGTGPVEGARVSVMGDGIYHCHGFTDAGGIARVSPSIAVAGSAFVAVTAHNFYATLDTVEVVDAAQALVTLYQVAVDDDDAGPSQGNADGAADAGETLEISASLENIGQVAATGVMATLRTQDEFVTLSDSVASYGDIGPGMTATPDADFVAGIEAQAPDAHEAGMEVHISYSDTSVVRHFTLVLSAPDLRIAGIAADDAALGDGNGCIGPGETVEVTLTLANDGTGEGEDIDLTVSTRDAHTQVVSGTCHLAHVAAGTSAEASPPCVLSVSPACPGSHRIDLAVSANFASGRTAACTASVFVGGGLDENCEGGQGMWLHEDIVAGFLDQWHLEAYRNHTPGGTYSWKFGGPGPEAYAHYSHGALITPELCLGPNATLTFWHHIQVELESGVYASDGGIVEISSDGGLTWSRIAPLGGYPHRIWPGTSTPIPPETPCFAWTADWTRVEFDLSAYQGPARIRFNFGAGEHFTSEEGWYVDDISVTDDLASVRLDDGDLEEAPAAFALRGLRPNPLSGDAVIMFETPRRAPVLIEAFDVSGKKVQTIIERVFEPGRHSVDWRRTAGLSPGIYFIRMTAGAFEATRKAVILR
jgi:hypothetical protein